MKKINELTAAVARDAMKGLAKAGLTIAGFTAGGKIAAKTIGKLDPYKKTDPKKAKKAKKTSKKSVNEITKAQLVSQGIQTLNPYFTAKKIKRIKKVTQDISQLAKPQEDLKEKAGAAKAIKAVKAGAKQLIKSAKANKKAALKTVGAGVLSGMTWGAAETASHIANRKAIEKAALSQASKDVEHELKKKHGKRRGKVIHKRAVKKVQQTKKPATEAVKIPKFANLPRPAKIGLAVTGAVASDLAAELIADKIRKKHKKKKEVKK